MAAWRRTIQCEDGFKRERAITLTINDTGQVLLAPPPGECAVLNAQQVDQLRRDLHEGVQFAAHRALDVQAQKPRQS